MKILTIILIMILILITTTFRINIKNINSKYLLFEVRLFNIVKIKFKKYLKEFDIIKIIRKYSLNKEKEINKFVKIKSLVSKIIPSLSLNNLSINIHTSSEYTYFSFLILDCYIRTNLLNSFKLVKSYSLNYTYSDKTFYTINFDFSFKIYYVIYMLIRKNKFKRGVINGKSSKRNNEIVFR